MYSTCSVSMCSTSYLVFTRGFKVFIKFVLASHAPYTLYVECTGRISRYDSSYEGRERREAQRQTAAEQQANQQQTLSSALYTTSKNALTEWTTSNLYQTRNHRVSNTYLILNLASV